MVDYAKAVEGDAGLSVAFSIWKNLEVSKYGFTHVKAWNEAELSVATWSDCGSIDDYNKNRWHYQRLNDKVIRLFSDESKTNEHKFPSILRSYGKICRMTIDVATREINQRVNSASTKMAKAMIINEGQGLNLPIAHDFHKKTMTKAIEGGVSPAVAAQIATEGIKAVKEIALIDQMTRKELTKSIAMDLKGILDNNPQITMQDQKYQDKFGNKDSLSTMNGNVKKKTDENAG